MALLAKWAAAALALLSLALPSACFTELDPSTFQDFIQDGEFSLVVFYAPWSETWEKFESHFEEIDDKLADSPIQLGLVDVEEHIELSVESGKDTLAIKFYFADRVQSPPIAFRDSFYAERVMAFVEAISDSLVDTHIDGLEEIAAAFMQQAIYEPVMDKAHGDAHKAKIQALLDAESLPQKKAMLQLHLKVMGSIMMLTGNLSKNLHRLKEMLANRGQTLKIQDYIAVKNEIAVYEMYGEALLPDSLKKKKKKKAPKIQGRQATATVDAKGRQNILF